MESRVEERFCDVGNELILEKMGRVGEGELGYYMGIGLIEGVNGDEKKIKVCGEFLGSVGGDGEIIKVLG